MLGAPENRGAFPPFPREKRAARPGASAGSSRARGPGRFAVPPRACGGRARPARGGGRGARRGGARRWRFLFRRQKEPRAVGAAAAAGAGASVAAAVVALPSARLRLVPQFSVSSGPSLPLGLAAGSDLPGEAASVLTGVGEGARSGARAGGGRGDGGSRSRSSGAKRIFPVIFLGAPEEASETGGRARRVSPRLTSGPACGGRGGAGGPSPTPAGPRDPLGGRFAPVVRAPFVPAAPRGGRPRAPILSFNFQ